MERSQDAALGRARHALQEVGERGQPEDVRGQHELVAPVVGDRGRGGEECDARAPLLGPQLDLAREGVQVAHQRPEYFLQAGIVRAGERCDDRIGEGIAVDCLHASSRAHR